MKPSSKYPAQLARPQPAHSKPFKAAMYECAEFSWKKELENKSPQWDIVALGGGEKATLD